MHSLVVVINAILWFEFEVGVAGDIDGLRSTLFGVTQCLVTIKSKSRKSGCSRFLSSVGGSGGEEKTLGGASADMYFLGGRLCRERKGVGTETGTEEGGGDFPQEDSLTLEREEKLCKYAL